MRRWTGPPEAELLKVVDERLPDDGQLPIIETKTALAALDSAVMTSIDHEAVEFLMASKLAQIWKHAFLDETEALAQARAYKGDTYADRVRKEFLSEYSGATALEIPRGYAFKVNGRAAPPNLMQRFVTYRLSRQKRLDNWSGTGAGKTLSAILATRVVGAGLTVICCPNTIVEGWREAILETFPDSMVETKTFSPQWQASGEELSGLGREIEASHRYVVLNYEAFQQPSSPDNVRRLADEHAIDFIVVDEIHFTKQRSPEDLSLRKQNVQALIALAEAKNPDLYVLGMSATPVINNLQEGKSLVELITSTRHDDLKTLPTVPNCMSLHQRLVRLGARWMPRYEMTCEEITQPVDCSPYLSEIRAMGSKGTPLGLEQVLTRARLPLILASARPKTLIYTHYIQGIDRLLWDALTSDGWRVGFFTGDDKSGLDQFINGDLDVLIGTAAVGTGLDGLQQVCSRLIINVLPWTNAEYEQIKGRIYRQGQTADKVEVIIPLTFAEVNGQRWSWCESKMNRLRFKKSITDAAVDGVVPEGHLRSPAQAYQDVMGWLERLDEGQLVVVSRLPLVFPLPASEEEGEERRKRRYGDFSEMNRRWNQSRSSEVWKRLKEDSEEWAQYHTLYREARKDWAVVPYEELTRWFLKREGYTIGDFGCGEAKLAEALAGQHTVMSFDYVAINEEVTPCDMAHVPLEDGVLDAAVFSLSLMGANFTDYLREASRTLKLDGQLHIIEATSQFSDRARFIKGLESLGFVVVEIRDTWKFTHIHALKTDRSSENNVSLRF